MALRPGEVANNRDDALKAVAFLAGIDVERVVGYVLVTYIEGDETKIDASACCDAHVCAMLADLVAGMTADLAGEHAILLAK